jgi:phage terminase large subunit-like protein
MDITIPVGPHATQAAGKLHVHMGARGASSGLTTRFERVDAAYHSSSIYGMGRLGASDEQVLDLVTRDASKCQVEQDEDNRCHLLETLLLVGVLTCIKP